MEELEQRLREADRVLTDKDQRLAALQQVLVDKDQQLAMMQVQLRDAEKQAAFPEAANVLQQQLTVMQQVHVDKDQQLTAVQVQLQDAEKQAAFPDADASQPDGVAKRLTRQVSAAAQFRMKIGAARSLRHTVTQIRNRTLVERLTRWQHAATQRRSGAARELSAMLTLCVPAIQGLDRQLQRPQLRQRAITAVLNWQLALVKARELHGRTRMRQVAEPNP